jgi:ABC-2 type transport system permease protein
MTTLEAGLPAGRRTPASPWHVGLAMLARDARLLRKQFPAFVARVLVQPLLLLFTFSYVLPSASVGMAGSGSTFTTVMVPGIIASTMIFAGIMGVTVPLISELGFPREIDDRVLSPIPYWGIAVQKIVSGSVQSLLAALMIVPVLIYLHAPGQAPVLHVTNWPMLLSFAVLAAVLSAGLGLLLGTLLNPTKFNVLFNVIMMPALMLGCVYFPWAYLGHVRWLQVAVLVNPIVYLSESFRTVLTPSIPHLPTLVCVLALVLGDAAAVLAGVRSFRRRVRR